MVQLEPDRHIPMVDYGDLFAETAPDDSVFADKQALDDVERQLAALGEVASTKPTKDEKLAAICQFAQNGGGKQSTIAVTAAEIQGCVGVSRRYAYNLSDEAAEALAGSRVREATDVKTSTGVEHKKKALLVNCKEIHVDGADVDKLTTRNTANNGHTTEETNQETR